MKCILNPGIAQNKLQVFTLMNRICILCYSESKWKLYVQRGVGKGHRRFSGYLNFGCSFYSGLQNGWTGLELSKVKVKDFRFNE